MLSDPSHIASSGPSPKRSSGKMFPKMIGALVLVGLGIFLGRYVIPVRLEGSASFDLISIEDGQKQLNFPTFWEARDVLHANYIENLDDKELFYGAVAGMVRAVDDPYTVFADPEATKQFQETLSGSFSGVGVEIGVQNGLVTVIAPLEGSPADKAGVKEGDIIAAVNDNPIRPDQTLDEVVQQIRGQRGEAVNLKVIRENEPDPKDISVVRDTITIESIKLEMIDNFAHIRLTSFNGDTTEQFLTAIRDLKRQNARGVILDVRSNPGGFLQTAVELSSEFMDPGTVVVTEKGKREKIYKTSGSPSLKDIPVVVLVNGGSASASEIIAGALQEQRKAPIIGEKTFGKGSVQEMINLKDGSSLRITIAKWFTPEGRSINEEGIAPTIEVADNAETEEDEQLDRALEELRQQI